MDQELREIANHMRGLGLGALAHANWHANYSGMENAWWSELSVLQAAHAAELLIKARIAEEHPLLIFEKLPKSGVEDGQTLSFKQLVDKAKTLQFSELPDRLWAATGKRLKNLKKYNDFGHLRNTIQHFAVPNDCNIAKETISFIYEVIDPLINDCWGLFAVDFNEDHEPYIYLIEGLIENGVEFLVSPDAREAIVVSDLKWPIDKPTYRKRMERQFSVN